MTDESLKSGIIDSNDLHLNEKNNPKKLQVSPTEFLKNKDLNNDTN